MNKIRDFLENIQRNYYDIGKVIVFIIAAFIVVWQMPRTGKFKYEFQKNKPWQSESLYAPFDFPIYKTEPEIMKETELVRSSVKPIFVFNSMVSQKTRERSIEEFNRSWEGNDKYQRDINLNALLAMTDTIQSIGIIAYDKIIDELESESLIDIVKGNVVSTARYSDFFTTKTLSEYIQKWSSKYDSQINRPLLGRIMLSSLQHNVTYDKTRTEYAIERAASSVSLTYGMVQKDELIVSEGEVIGDATYNILSSLQREYENRSLSEGEVNRTLLGQIALVLLIFVVMYVYIRLLHRNDIYADLSKINLLLLVVLIVTIPSFWIVKVHPIYIYAMPVCLVSFITVTFFSPSTAFIIQMLSAALISVSVPNPFNYMFLQIVASTCVLFGLYKRDSRMSYFFSSLIVLAVYMIGYASFCAITGSKIEFFMLGLLGLNALFTMLALPLISLFEKIFDFTTLLTLLELSNTNRPLLRKLSITAPGSFQHSMQVANLCEEVLYEIGGDALLARTGALYHDIGKIQNPTFFTENHKGGQSPHDDLSNKESAQIIISHVIDGINLAQKAKLPSVIIDFIRTHHGTRQTDYFYITEQRLHPGEEIDPRPFTYHGPIPFSRETAVLMICDSVEAAMHSVKDPDEQKIAKKVDDIIDKQMATGQFKNTDLTLRDFTNIRKVLKKKIMSIYHVRIAYPSN